jgi:pimeloyl-ACP methyl ester carboxylesterase
MSVKISADTAAGTPAEAEGRAFTATTLQGPIAGSVHGEQEEWAGTVLLMHGGPGLTDYIAMLGAELAGWRWITYQQRGHAPSTTQGPFTVERHVADAVAVLDTVGADQVIVLGHSWGGHLAMHFALSHPERVAGLVIIDPLGAVGDGGGQDLGAQLHERLLPGAAERFAEVAERLAGPKATDEDFLESLALVWPGYFADPPTAPAIPAAIRASLAAYAGTSASVGEHFAGGFAAKLSAVTAPARAPRCGCRSRGRRPRPRPTLWRCG